ncbi:hypothetical protein ACFO0A_07115 [Novosphingobium tardum]|uniref:SH3 domain-containing protein n=1 Tax=Novosphingobium tardum TaxID=1538021 RepID=A0ABV8RN94_9SPHN
MAEVRPEPVLSTGTPEPPAPAPMLPAKSYRPRDECAALPEFPAFRDKLFSAIRARDVAALLPLFATDVRLDFGGGAGREELGKRLTSSPGLWDSLAGIVPLGCAADGGIATLPWIFSRVPDDIDPGVTMLATGPAVAVRKSAEPEAKVMRRLDWNLIAVNPPSSAKDIFVKVAGDGATGYVARKDLRSVLDYRLVADRGAQGWQITAFVAGD